MPGVVIASLLLARPLLRAGAALFAAVFVAAMWVGLHHERARAAELAGRLVEAQAQSAALRADHNRIVGALEAQAAANADAAFRDAEIERTIHALPPSRACAVAPAMRAALDGLRRAAAVGAAGAGQPAAVPGPARRS